MVSGAPTPGGYNAVPPGGYTAPPAGGMSMNSPVLRNQLDGYPIAYPISPQGASGANGLAITRNVQVRLGTATGVTYSWAITTRPGGVAALTGASTATMGFTPDAVGNWLFTVTCTFNNGVVDTETVTYTTV